MGHLCFLHASLTEYLIFFGSPTPTSGKLIFFKKKTN